MFMNKIRNNVNLNELLKLNSKNTNINDTTCNNSHNLNIINDISKKEHYSGKRKRRITTIMNNNHFKFNRNSNFRLNNRIHKRNFTIKRRTPTAYTILFVLLMSIAMLSILNYNVVQKIEKNDNLNTDGTINSLGSGSTNSTSMSSPIFNIIPNPAAYNTRLYLLEINQSHTLCGENFTFSGYVQKFNITSGQFENASGLPVYPIIDGTSWNGLESTKNYTIRSGVNGTFNFSINVPNDYDYTKNISILANITEIPAENIYVNQLTVQNSSFSHDITTKTYCSIETNIDPAVLPGDNFFAALQLTDESGAGITMNNINLYSNLDNDTPLQAGLTLTSGSLNTPITEQENMTQLLMEFPGFNQKHDLVFNDTYYEYEPSYNTTIIQRVESIEIVYNITNLDNTSDSDYVYASGNVQIDGNVTGNNNSFPIANRQLDLYINNQTTPFTTISTDENGQFSYQFNLENDAGFTETNQTVYITIVLSGYDKSFSTGNQTFLEQVPIEIRDAPIPPVEEPPAPDEDSYVPPEEAAKINWVGILIPIALVAGLVFGIVMFQRKRMDIANQKDWAMRAVDKPTKFGIISMLYNMGRKREALAYTYKIYTDLINEKYALEKEPSQTIRAFAVIGVTKYGLDPLRIYPYVSMIERVIYGAPFVDDEMFSKVLRMFSLVYQEITGQQFNFNANISNREIGELVIDVENENEQDSADNPNPVDKIKKVALKFLNKEK